MAKLTKKEMIRRYAEKNPMMTVREMASDLDLSPPYIHSVLWTLRKEGKAPPSKNPRSRRTTIVDVINKWEGKVTPSNPVNAKDNLIDHIIKTDAERTGFAPAPVKNEGTFVLYDSAYVKTNDIHPSELHALEMKVEEQRIIIQYLEKRLDEEKAKGS